MEIGHLTEVMRRSSCEELRGMEVLRDHMSGNGLAVFGFCFSEAEVEG